jgi:hypothetical protein
MASTIDNQHQLTQIASQNDISLPEGKRWFYQINQSETLEDVMDIILPEW